MAYYPIYQQAYGLYGGAPTLPALAAPANAQATATSSTALSVTASSVANAAGYQLYTSATQAGAYAKLGGVLTTPSYSHTGLSAGQTQWYKWVAVGDGVNYRDSAQTAAFSGTTASGTAPIAPAVSFDAPTRILTATHSLGGSEIEYKRNGGVWVAYAPIMVDNRSHLASEWLFRTRAAGSRPAGDTAGSPAIAATSTGQVQIPANRSAKIPLSTASYNKAQAAAQRVYSASTITFNDGSVGISPGTGNPYYATREWKRDSYFAHNAFLDFFSAQQLTDSLNRFLLNVDANNRVPDRITTAGVVERTPFPGIVDSPMDNNFFFIEDVWLLYKKTGSATYYQSKKANVDAIYNAIPSQNECAYLPAQTVGQQLRSQFFGFFDSKTQTGYGTYGIAGQYRACCRLADLNQALGLISDAQAWVDKAARIKDFFNSPACGLWDDTFGMFRSASLFGREVHDVPSNALAVECGLADDAKALRISQKLNDTIAEWSFRGGIRHIMSSDEAMPGVTCWRYFVGPNGDIFEVYNDAGQIVNDGKYAGTPSPYGEYQNGGYWYTFIREILTTLALTNQPAAAQLLYDAVYYANLDLANRDNVEVLSADGKFRCTQYVGSAAGVLSLVASGGTDPAGVTPDPPMLAPANVEEDAQHVSLDSWTRDSDWVRISNNGDVSNSGAYYLLAGSASTAVSNTIRLLAPQYLHVISNTGNGLGVLQVALVPAGSTPGTNDWLDADQSGATRPYHVVAASATAYSVGDYQLFVRAKPGTTGTVIHDAIRLSPVRTAPN